VSSKVIYVSHIRLTDKVSRDFYVADLVERGLQVEYWDVVSLVREEHAERGAFVPPYLHVLRSFGELESKLRLPQNKVALYVILVGYGGQFTKLYRLLSKHGCRMLTFAWGAMPHSPLGLRDKIAIGLSQPRVAAAKLFYRLKATLWRRLNLVHPFHIVFSAGNATVSGGQYARTVVPVNLYDYDHYRRAKSAGGRLVEGRYAVFLDINLPHQSDLAVCGYARIDSSNYYAALNRFFRVFEQRYGMEVVIAAHPKADYVAATFEGRKTLRMVTAELVKDAEIVLSHTSTSLSYAVLNHKPLLFLYTNEMAAVYADSIIRETQCYADYLDSSICNVDEVADTSQLSIREVNRESYDRFKYNYLTSPASENSETRDIFLRSVGAS
jgi:hypothetical protein